MEYEIKEKLNEIAYLLKSNYKTIENPGLAGGKSGIAHIYNRMYSYTKIEKFKEISDFWYGKTLKMAKYEDAYTEFKTGNQPIKDFGSQIIVFWKIFPESNCH